MKFPILILLFFLSFSLLSQTNFRMTNPLVEDILKGNYDPQEYESDSVILDPRVIFQAIQNQVEPDRLRSYLETLSSFETRHSSSDTLSPTTGIGAARRWIFDQFATYGSATPSSEGISRLQATFFQFDGSICGVEQHRNVCAVLPGSQTEDKSIVIVEAHMDSRCEDECDITCTAQGMEDNGSGTAMVMELARVLSQFQFERTIVFMLTTGEEQGLFGAEAFVNYCMDEDIEIHAVFNNDIVGGISCGKTSSPPSCPFEGAIDSTQVRLFSSGKIHRQFCRWIKLEYMEETLPLVEVPMMLSMMNVADRGGRGGDHLPFTRRDYRSMRFTSSYENGNASIIPSYVDHQHSSRDVLGVDTNGDGELDSLFVDFNYLSRNTVINGVSISAAAINPQQPIFSFEVEPDSILWTVEDPLQLNHYRISRRTKSIDYDTIFTFTGVSSGRVPRYATTTLFDEELLSGASVDNDGIESFFSEEDVFLSISATDELSTYKGAAFLLQNVSNPFRSSTVISYQLTSLNKINRLEIELTDMLGRQVHRFDGPKLLGINSFSYYPSPGMQGTYNYSLLINGKVTDTKRMVVMH